MADFFWNAKKTPEHLNVMLRCFAEAYPAVFHETEGERELILKKGAAGQLTVSIGKRQCTVEAGSPSAFARGIGSVMAGCPVRESTSFQTIGIMLDCSRNKVFRVDFRADGIRIEVVERITRCGDDPSRDGIQNGGFAGGSTDINSKKHGFPLG